ncbi:hypothetical protein [Nitrosarchaeum sp.]|uniref:hypothetical protein n=1 Tax=Nitrosarchaeum sp. TaxID=2026886 RepID=UPI00247DC46C|nr:hypothetical protein [Nitrosarchaeum sp.]MCV0412327.1 hypothetical protein [Nitrosarchaeum sp.]
MKYTVALFTVLAFAAIFAMVTPMDAAVAQPSSAMPDGEYKDGDHEGKSCPSKEKKTASSDADLNI